MDRKKIGLLTATSVVVANMVGTGVFTSLGFQVLDLTNGLALLLLWLSGGIMALCGAFVYSELGSVYPQSGGEYNFLSRIYHPALGFSSGFVSMLVGFSAPVALAAMAFSKYALVFLPALNEKFLALAVVLLVTLIHSFSINAGGLFQKYSTIIKVTLILIFVLLGVYGARDTGINFMPTAATLHDLTNPAFAVSMVYVSYAYSGWNAASYLTEEIEEPKKNLPKALINGTLLVTVLYLALNLVFLLTVPISGLKGVLEVGHVSAQAFLGKSGGLVMSAVISLLLVSSISSMVMAGPRVTVAMSNDQRFMPILGKVNNHNVPVYAVWVQALLTVFLIATSQFENVMAYIGFTLSLFTSLTVIGVFIVRKRYGANIPFKSPLYPLLPIVFLAINVWVMWFVVKEKPHQSALGLLTAFAGILIYFGFKSYSANAKK